MLPKHQALKSSPYLDNIDGWLQQLADNRETLRLPASTKTRVWKNYKNKFEDDGSWTSITLYNRYLHHAGIQIGRAHV